MIFTYLAATLPYLALGKSPPISIDDFRTSCSGLLKDPQFRDLDRLLDGNPEFCETPFGQVWSDLETQIINECARKRRPGLEKKLRMHRGYSVLAREMVQDAFNRETPQEREWVLDRGRFLLLENLARPGSLGLERILAFAGQLRLVHRWAQFDEQRGRKRFQDLVEETVKEVRSEERGARKAERGTRRGPGK